MGGPVGLKGEVWTTEENRGPRRREGWSTEEGGGAGPEWSDHSQLEPSEVKTPFQQEEVDSKKGGFFFSF